MAVIGRRCIVKLNEWMNVLLRVQIRTKDLQVKTQLVLWIFISIRCRSQWARGLSRRSAAARLLRSWVRIPPGAWMFVCCECCMLSGRGLCDELITRPEESYRLRCVVVCDLETSRMRRPWPALGRSAIGKKKLFKVTRWQHVSAPITRPSSGHK